ncbi:MAG: hypothetical protein LYZ69_01790 [Nitrososphaerales archaeon]|nr:hypothetical protein [Nitrososphaerales archaeon]
MKDGVRISIHGLIGGLGLLSVYFAIVTLAQGFGHAVAEFISLSHLMVPLVVGFGIQVSLFSYTRHYAKAIQSSASVTAGGGVSTASMIACCAHHVTDLVPFAGITAAAIFLTAYQTFFIFIGLLSNMVGITVMLAIIQKHRLYNPQGLLARIMTVDMAKVRNLAIAATMVAVLGLGWATAIGATAPGSVQSNVVSLQEKGSDANGLSVTVTPAPLAIGKNTSFDIKMDTHVGDLSFDLTRTAYLQDGNGTKYIPLQWSGSPPGGHHREGILVFPPLTDRPASITLVLGNLYGAERIFTWNTAG